MLGELLHRSDQDVELAQRGIVFIDEIDKIARRSQGARTGAGSRDIGGEGVQQGLLKLLEGREIFAPLNVTQHWNKHDFVVVDTQDILFIAAGTFSDLHLAETPKAVGFGAELDAGGPSSRRVTEKELLDYGFLAEFLGRLPVRVELEPLSEDDLYLIMTGPPDAVVREYQALLKMDGVDLRFADEGLRAIAQYCLRHRTGARSLRTIVEEICHDVMFEAPERKGETVTIDDAAVAAHLDRMGGAAGAR
jgi:ATP-dependent Clp protease ATP-binding subunit ClpX